MRAALSSVFRRSQICLGHHQFVRLDVLQGLGGFPTAGATEDSTLGYMLGARGVLIRPMPMIELTDLPETKEKIIRQNARWYQGVLDDVAYLWAAWRAAPSAFNLAQFVRHVVNKVVEWPVAAFVYPAMGYLGWHFAYAYRQEHPLLFLVAVAVPTVSLGLTSLVGASGRPSARCRRWSRSAPAYAAGREHWSERLLATSAVRRTGSSPRARRREPLAGRPGTAATSRARRTGPRAAKRGVRRSRGRGSASSAAIGWTLRAGGPARLVQRTRSDSPTR